jgi:hypothetical protein
MLEELRPTHAVPTAVRDGGGGRCHDERTTARTLFCGCSVLRPPQAAWVKQFPVGHGTPPSGTIRSR